MTGTPLQAERTRDRHRYHRRRKRLDALGAKYIPPNLAHMTTAQFTRLVRDLKKLNRDPLLLPYQDLQQ